MSRPSPREKPQETPLNSKRWKTLRIYTTRWRQFMGTSKKNLGDGIPNLIKTYQNYEICEIAYDGLTCYIKDKYIQEFFMEDCFVVVSCCFFVFCVFQPGLVAFVDGLCGFCGCVVSVSLPCFTSIYLSFYLSFYLSIFLLFYLASPNQNWIQSDLI